MAEPPDATLVHDSPGRLRLRLPALRGDAGRLSALALAVAELPGVAAAQGAVVTGSLLVLHRRRAEEVLGAAEAAGLFTLHAAGPPPGPLPPIAPLPAAGAAAMAFLALFQLLRREALPPAFTLGWHALDLARQAVQAGRAAPGEPVLSRNAPTRPD